MESSGRTKQGVTVVERWLLKDLVERWPLGMESDTR